MGCAALDVSQSLWVLWCQAVQAGKMGAVKKRSPLALERALALALALHWAGV